LAPPQQRYPLPTPDWWLRSHRWLAAELLAEFRVPAVPRLGEHHPPRRLGRRGPRGTDRPQRGTWPLPAAGVCSVPARSLRAPLGGPLRTVRADQRVQVAPAAYRQLL
ncbi:MAG TPA: hypothetical protein VFQ77_17870, partial [Pseudonocardiaceae bacterium]|nr:hypothetical protein [Pseudonocardiaceae bacterium]